MKNDGLKSSFADLTGLIVLIAAMACLMYYDPFAINRRIADFLRLKFVIFTKEPRLLFYTYMYVGSFIAKAAAVLLIIILLIARRTTLDENLALKAPSSEGWRVFIVPFTVMAVAIRTYYSTNPLVPNLPTRLVFPEAMVLGNIIIILSVLFIAPVTEELIFRGYIFDVIKRSFGAIPSILFTSALFAFAHFPKMDFELLDIGIIFTLGLAFAILRHRTGSIVVPIFFHFLYNLVYVALGAFYYFTLGY